MKSGSGLLGRNAENAENAVTANIVGTERDRAASPRTDGNENGLNAQSAPVGFALPRDLNPSRSTSTLFSVVMPIPIRFQNRWVQVAQEREPYHAGPIFSSGVLGVLGVSNPGGDGDDGDGGVLGTAMTAFLLRKRSQWPRFFVTASLRIVRRWTYLNLVPRFR
jgi:hypothetical protein